MRTLSALTLLALLLTGCGGGESDTSADPTTEPTSSASASAATQPTSDPTTDEPEAPADDEQQVADRFIAYADAFFGGDAAAAYEILSSRCREKYPLSEFASNAELAAETYGAVEPTVESVVVEGDVATLRAKVGIAALDDAPAPTEPNWVREDGEWFSDKCD